MTIYGGLNIVMLASRFCLSGHQFDRQRSLFSSGSPGTHLSIRSLRGLAAAYRQGHHFISEARLHFSLVKSLAADTNPSLGRVIEDDDRSRILCGDLYADSNAWGNASPALYQSEIAPLLAELRHLPHKGQARFSSGRAVAKPCSSQNHGMCKNLGWT